MAKQLFGTDGMRGVPGTYPLDDPTLERLGFALGEYLLARAVRAGGTKPRVLIGRDTRESGPHIAELIARGLCAAGVEAVSAGVLTTPGVAWLVSREGFSAGVVISASHNPYHDNGVKLISASGMKFPDADGSGNRSDNSGCGRRTSRARRTASRSSTTRTTSACTRIIWVACAARCCRARSWRE